MGLARRLASLGLGRRLASLGLGPALRVRLRTGLPLLVGTVGPPLRGLTRASRVDAESLTLGVHLRH